MTLPTGEFDACMCVENALKTRAGGTGNTMPNHEELIQELETLRLPELQRRFLDIVGEESRCPNKAFLIRRIRQTLEGEVPSAANVAEPAEILEEDANDVTVAEAAEIPAAEPSPPVEGAVTVAAPPARIIPLKRKKTPKAVAVGNVRGRFKSMTIEELQTMYRDRVGRETGSTHRAYLQWKIREAEKGRIPVGPRENRLIEQQSAVDIRILPLRLDVRAIEEMDAAWKAKGMKTRMDFFRRALAHYLEEIGAHSAAELFGTRQAESSPATR